MKKIGLLIIIITLPIIAFFQYKKSSRFSPPSAYDYTISEEIDSEYYDQEAVLQYFKNAQHIGNYARFIWNQQKIDVRFPNLNKIEEKNAASYYEELIAYNKLLEKKFKHSLTLKKMGYDNHAVKVMFEEGLTPKQFEIKKYEHLLGLKQGDNSSNVLELQKLVIASGHTIPYDGKFGIETAVAIKQIQKENELPQTGVCDKETLNKLLKL